MARGQWGGTTLEFRRAQRRQQLLEAGVLLLAEGGTAAFTVRAVCRVTGLSERYFYEHFLSRDQLVYASFDIVAEEVSAMLTEAVAGAPKDPEGFARAAVAAVIKATIDEPSRGRVLFLAPADDSMLRSRGDIVGHALVAMLRDQIPASRSSGHRDLVASSLAGALAYTFRGYVAGTLEVTRKEFSEHCVQLLLTLASMPDPKPRRPRAKAKVAGAEEPATG
ncbi:TetR/AcrR family transcriptional regulator [Nocardioides sp. Bht2]|uniref:TetR/AcrR family transcriptional regulator n=1 Tax=Nocardioides sp. Bht2 TaxID=3392297 RepID=UPI0039B53DF4